MSTSPSPAPSDILGEQLLKKLLTILILYQVVALIAIGLWAALSWNKSDVIVIWVPQAVMEWALIGAIAGALYRISSYPKLNAQEKAGLYLWVIAKPFVSTALGCVVCFMFVGGLLTLTNNSITHTETLSVIAFLAAFSDRFALSALDKLSLSKPSERSG